MRTRLPVVPGNALEKNMADEEGAYYLERILFAQFTLFLQLFSFLELNNSLEDDFKMYFCLILPEEKLI